MDEAIALTTAGNAILQDPNSVGTGLKMISLRLTGTKEASEELAAMGEDVDGMITTQSKLRQTILDATKVASNGFQGFDILDENGNYKSTFEIMKGIADIYAEIEETDKKYGQNNKNLLLETVAGKNRSSVAASIFANPDILNNVYESSQNSEGSAQEELDKYLDSIEGHIARLQNRLQELAFTAIDSDGIKMLVDLLTLAVQGATALTKALGSVNIVIGALFTGMTKFKKGGTSLLDFNPKTEGKWVDKFSGPLAKLFQSEKAKSVIDKFSGFKAEAKAKGSSIIGDVREKAPVMATDLKEKTANATANLKDRAKSLWEKLFSKQAQMVEQADEASQKAMEEAEQDIDNTTTGSATSEQQNAQKQKISRKKDGKAKRLKRRENQAKLKAKIQAEAEKEETSVDAEQAPTVDHTPKLKVDEDGVKQQAEKVAQEAKTAIDSAVEDEAGSVHPEIKVEPEVSMDDSELHKAEEDTKNAVKQWPKREGFTDGQMENINAWRQKNGLPPVDLNAEAEQVAKAEAEQRARAENWRKHGAERMVKKTKQDTIPELTEEEQIKKKPAVKRTQDDRTLFQRLFGLNKNEVEAQADRISKEVDEAVQDNEASSEPVTKKANIKVEGDIDASGVQEDIEKETQDAIDKSKDSYEKEADVTIKAKETSEDSGKSDSSKDEQKQEQEEKLAQKQEEHAEKAKERAEQTSDALKEQGERIKDATEDADEMTDAMDKIGDSTEKAKEAGSDLAEQAGQMPEQVDQVGDALGNAADATDDVADGMQKADDQMVQTGADAADAADKVDDIGKAASDATVGAFSLKSAFGSIGSVLANVGGQIVSMAANMLIATAASKLITTGLSLIGKVWDSFAHRNEHMLEDAKNAKQAIEDINKSYAETENQTNTLGKRYNELRKGVAFTPDGNTVVNKSLSEDEYAEFLDINKQLASLYPSLITGQTKQGDSLVDLGTDARTATEKLKEYLEVQREISNYEIASHTQAQLEGMVFENKKLEKGLDETNEDLGEAQRRYEKYAQGFTLISSGKTDKYWMDLDVNDFDAVQNVLDVIAFNDTGAEIVGASQINEKDERVFRITVDGDTKSAQKAIEDLTSAISGNMKEAYDATQRYQEQYNASKKQISDNWKDFGKTLSQSIQTGSTYRELISSSDEIEQAFNTMLDNVDYQDIYNHATKAQQDSFVPYLRDMFVYSFDAALDAAGPDGSPARQAMVKNFEDFFSLDISQLDTQSIKDTVSNSLDALFPQDEELKKQIRIALGYTFVDDEGQEAWSVDSLDEQVGNIISSQSGKGLGKLVLSRITKQLTNEQKNIMLNAKDFTLPEFSGGINNYVAELIKAIDAYQKRMSEVDKTGKLGDILNSESYKTAADEIEKKLSSLTSALDQFDQQGTITAETMKGLQEQFPEMTDFSQEGIQHYATQQLSDWVGQFSSAWTDFSPEGIKQLDTYLQNLIGTFSDVEVSASDARQEIVDTFKETYAKNGLSEFDAVTAAYSHYDAAIAEIKKQYGLEDQDINWNIILALKGYIGKLDPIEFAEKYGEFEGHWQIYVDNQDQLEELGTTLTNLQSQQSEIEAGISYRETRGLKKTVKQYDDLLDNNREQVKTIRNQNKLLRDQQSLIRNNNGEIDTSAKAYKALQKQIDDNNANLRSLGDAQRENMMNARMIAGQNVLDTIGTLKTALGEGGLGADTLTSLIQQMPGAADVLFHTSTGQYVDTQEMQELIKTQGDLAVAIMDTQQAFNQADYDANAKQIADLSKQYGIAEGDVKALNEAIAAASNDADREGLQKLFDLTEANETLEATILRTQALKEELLMAQSALGRYQLAQSSANPSDNMQTIRGGLENAKKLYDQGWVGKDDFTTFAELLATEAEIASGTAVENFEKNYEKAQRYLTEDASGVWNWFDDMVEKSFATFDESTGEYALHVDNMEAFAAAMGTSKEFAEDMLMAMRDAGFDVNLDVIAEEFANSFNQIDYAANNAGQQVQNLINEMQQLADSGVDVSGSAEFAAEAIQKLAAQGVDVSAMVEQLNQIGNLNGFHIDPFTLEVTTKVDKKELTETKREAQQGTTMPITTYVGATTSKDIDLNHRTRVSPEDMRYNGYTDFDGDYATLYSSAQSTEDGMLTIVATPILPNGDVIDPDTMDEYFSNALSGGQVDTNLELARFYGEDSIERANKYSEMVHNHELFDADQVNGYNQAISGYINTLKQFSQEDFNQIKFGDNATVAGLESAEKSLDGILTELGFGQEYGESLLMVLGQMGLIDFQPEIDTQGIDDAKQSVEELNESAQSIKLSASYGIDESDVQEASARLKEVFGEDTNAIKEAVEQSGILNYNLSELLNINHGDGTLSAGESELEALAASLGLSNDQCSALLAALVELGLIEVDPDVETDGIEDAEKAMDDLHESAETPVVVETQHVDTTPTPTTTTTTVEENVVRKESPKPQDRTETITQQIQFAITNKGATLQEIKDMTKDELVNIGVDVEDEELVQTKQIVDQLSATDGFDFVVKLNDEQFNALTSNEETKTYVVNADTEEALNKISDVQTKLDGIEDGEAKVNVETSTAFERIRTVSSKLNNLSGQIATPSVSVIDAASSTIRNINIALASIPRTVTTTIVTKRIEISGGKMQGGRAQGTAHAFAQGTAYDMWVDYRHSKNAWAAGTTHDWALKHDEEALVNEFAPQNPESIVNKLRLYTVMYIENFI